MLVPQRAADGGLELIDGGPIVPERAQILERRLPMRALGVEEVEEVHAAPAVGELQGVTGLLGLRQIILGNPVL